MYQQKSQIYSIYPNSQNFKMAQRQEDYMNKLTIHHKTKLDDIRNNIPKPKGYLPSTSLPTWEKLPVEKKIPLVPAPQGLFQFTRGQLDENLVRPSPNYSVWDPSNRERIPSNKYEILHDPNLRLRNNQLAMKALQRNGSINEKSEAVCSLAEFNRYRLYLGSQFTDKVKEMWMEMDKYEDMQIQQNRAFAMSLTGLGAARQSAKRTAGRERAKEFQRIKEKKTCQKFQNEQMRREQQLAAHGSRKLLEQSSMVQANEDKRCYRQQKILDTKEVDEQRRKDILIKFTAKRMRSEEQQQMLEQDRKDIIENNNKMWFEAKMLSASERLEREFQMQAAFSDTLRKKGARRQKNVEKFRDELPVRNARRQAEKQRLDAIVRKYAMRWLNKVRERLNKPRDELHESVWYTQAKNNLQDCVKELYITSGYEKLDDVVFNVLKFKEALKRQLLLEEEEDEEEMEVDLATATATTSLYKSKS